MQMEKTSNYTDLKEKCVSLLKQLDKIENDTTISEDVFIKVVNYRVNIDHLYGWCNCLGKFYKKRTLGEALNEYEEAHDFVKSLQRF